MTEQVFYDEVDPNLAEEENDVQKPLAEDDSDDTRINAGAPSEEDGD